MDAVTKIPPPVKEAAHQADIEDRAAGAAWEQFTINCSEVSNMALDLRYDMNDILVLTKFCLEEYWNKSAVDVRRVLSECLRETSPETEANVLKALERAEAFIHPLYIVVEKMSKLLQLADDFENKAWKAGQASKELRSDVKA